MTFTFHTFTFHKATDASIDHHHRYIQVPPTCTATTSRTSNPLIANSHNVAFTSTPYRQGPNPALGHRPQDAPSQQAPSPLHRHSGSAGIFLRGCVQGQFESLPLSALAWQHVLTSPPQKSSNKQSGGSSVSPVETDDLFLKKAWEIALAPAKSIPMNAIMMYMSGNTLQIFSIMMTAMLFMNPLKALTSVGATFARFDNERTHSRLWPVKLAYIALQIATIVLGIWKVNGMGLLPYAGPLSMIVNLELTFARTTRSDWLAWERERTPLEYSAPAFQAPGFQ